MPGKFILCSFIPVLISVNKSNFTREFRFPPLKLEVSI